MAIRSLSSSSLFIADVGRGRGTYPNVAAKLARLLTTCCTAFLVARNGRSGQDDGIALVDGKCLVLAGAQCGRQRLALRTGAHDDDLIVGQVIDIEGIDDIGIVDVGEFQLTRHAGVGEHGTSGHDDLAATLAGGVADLLQAMDVARERRDEHAARGVLDGVQQVGPTSHRTW